jgi:phage gp29-like protein
MAGAGPELRLLTKGAPLDGVAIPAAKMIVHRHGGLYEDPWGLGLGNRLFWPAWFKRQGIGFWLSALEKFGQPTAVGKYPAGATKAQQDTLLQALQAVASEAGVIIPEGMVIELLEAKRSGQFDAYESLARYMDGDITQVVLGEELTTSAGDQGSRALGQVHNGVRLEITKADADRLSDTLNASLVRWIVDFNRPESAQSQGYPKLWWDISVPEDLAARADRDTKVYQLGYRPTPEYVASTYGEGWLPRDAGPAPGTPPAPGAQFAEGWDRKLARLAARRSAPTLPPADDPRDAADLLTDQLDTLADPPQTAIVDALRGMVLAAESLEAVRDGLLRLYPTLPVAQLAELMGQALTVAALSGRADLTDGG